MSLKDQLLSDIKDAMKAGDSQRLTVLRGVSAAIKNKALTKPGGAELTEEEVLGVVTAEAKKRKDAIAAFTSGNRADLAENEQKELAMLEKYLPRQLTQAELEQIVDKTRSETGVQEFGPLMKAVMAQVRGRADGAQVTEIVKKKLGS